MSFIVVMVFSTSMKAQDKVEVGVGLIWSVDISGVVRILEA